MNRAGVVVAVLAAAAAGAACSGSRAAERSGPGAAPTVAVARIGRGDIAQSLTIAAEFRPFQEIEVHAKVAGFLKSIGVDVGDRVKTGQLLAVLEIPELQEEIKEDAASVARAGEEVNRAQADLQRAESAHEVSHLASTRLAGVMKARPNLVAQQDVDESLAKDRMAEAQMATAKAALAGAQEQLAVSKAQAGRTQTLLEYTRIVAPFAGVVTHRYADTGAMIQAGTSSQTQAMPVIKLSATDRLRLNIAVPESAVAQIRIGAPVDIRVDAVRRTFTGVVARFAGKVDPDTRTMPTEVDVPNPDLTLVPGMYAYASIALAGEKGVLTVPVQAIDRAEEKTTVLVVAGDRIERRSVSLGIDTPERVEIVRGLAEGDLVVVGNRSQLRPGTAVTPKVEAPAAPPAATEGER
jgi:RND family efflux transporter MFP subunit